MAGIASPESLRQYAAIARMRMSMLAHSVRTTRGSFDLVAQILAWGLYLFLGIGFAVGFGAGSYYFVSHGDVRLLSVLLWGALLLWQMVPIMAVSFREAVDLSSLLRFPLGFGAYYVLFLFFGLFDLSTIFGGFSLLGMAIGIGAARVSLLPAAIAGLLLFAAFNLLLTRTIFAWIDRWLAQRRTREILGVCFFVVVLGIQLLNPAIQRYKGKPSAATMRDLQRLEPVNRVLPPGLVEGSIDSLGRHQPAGTAKSLGGLLLYGVCAGALLGVRLRAQYRGESLSEAPSRKAAAQSRSARHTGLLDVTGPIAAIFVKEARYLMRSYQLLYGLVAPLILMLVFSGSQHGHKMPFAPARFALPLGVLYAFLGLTRMLYNNLGIDGPGLQFYFTSPVSMRKVMLGKNLFHATLLLLELAGVWLVASLRFGAPTLPIAVVTLCWITFAAPANFMAANILSIQAPYRMNFSRLGRPQGATANSLLSLLTQVTIGVIGGVVYFAAIHFHDLWLAAPIFLGLGVIAGTAYWRVLANVDMLARKRIEPLLYDLSRSAG